MTFCHFADAQNNKDSLKLKPNVYASINGKTSGIISIDELLNNQIVLNVKNSKVEKFTLSFFDESGKNLFEHKFTGNKIGYLSENEKNNLLKTKKVYFENIVVIEESGYRYKVPALIFTIKK